MEWKGSATSVLNSILEQVSNDATVQNLAAKVGLSPDQAEQAIAALGQAEVRTEIPFRLRRKTQACPRTSSPRLYSILAAKEHSVSSRRCSRDRAAHLLCSEV